MQFNKNPEKNRPKSDHASPFSLTTQILFSFMKMKESMLPKLRNINDADDDDEHSCNNSSHLSGKSSKRSLAPAALRAQEMCRTSAPLTEGQTNWAGDRVLADIRE